MTPTTPDQLVYTDNEEANRLIAHDPMALLIGFVLDQQVPVMHAFSGPLELKRRIGSIEPRHIAEMDPAALDAAFRERPALHRFPGNMAKRTRDPREATAGGCAGDPRRIWTDAADARTLRARLLALPGIGEMKAATILGILV